MSVWIAILLFVIVPMSPAIVGVPIERAVAGLVPVGHMIAAEGCGTWLSARWYAPDSSDQPVALVFSVHYRLALVYLYGRGDGVANGILAADRAGVIQYVWRGRGRIDAFAICALVREDAQEDAVP